MRKLLTMRQVKNIRTKYANGSKQVDLARTYNVDRATMSKIINNKIYVEQLQPFRIGEVEWSEVVLPKNTALHEEYNMSAQKPDFDFNEYMIAREKIEQVLNDYEGRFIDLFIKEAESLDVKRRAEIVEYFNSRWAFNVRDAEEND